DYGVAFSQLHAVELADMDRDGVLDIVTGKRYWAHAEHDPGSLDPAVLYWFRTVRDHGKVRFIPYRIDMNSGVGTQVTVGDLNGDKWDDVVVGNKKGTFVFIHDAREATKKAWQAAQPMPTRQSAPVQATKPQPIAESPPPASSTDAGFPAKSADGR